VRERERRERERLYKNDHERFIDHRDTEREEIHIERDS
jgi:hypothetical protein